MDLAEAVPALLAVLSVVVVLGVVGDILSFIVWLKGPVCKKSSGAAYLLSLAVVDTIMMLFPVIDLYMYLAPGALSSPLFTFFCEIMPFVVSAIVRLSSWIVACLSLERAIQLQCFAHRSAMLTNASNKRQLAIVAVLTISSFALNAYTLSSNALIEDGKRLNDTLQREFSAALENGFALPDIVIPGGNTGIAETRMNGTQPVAQGMIPCNNVNSSASNHDLFPVTCMNESSTFGKKSDLASRFNITSNVCGLPGGLHSPKYNFEIEIINGIIFSFTVPSVILVYCNIVFVMKLMQRVKIANTLGSMSELVRERQAQVTTHTKKTVAIGVIQVLRNLPTTVLQLYILVNGSKWSATPESVLVVYMVCKILMYVSSGANIIMYSVVVKNFRTDLASILKCLRCSQRDRVQC